VIDYKRGTLSVHKLDDGMQNELKKTKNKNKDIGYLVHISNTLSSNTISIIHLYGCHQNELCFCFYTNASMK